MKIGILTLPFNNNYGGYLQCYALMTVMKQMGHDVELIYRRMEPKYTGTTIPSTIKNTIKCIIKYLLDQQDFIIPKSENLHRWHGRNLMPFVDKHITKGAIPLYSEEELYRHIDTKRFDAIVVGSDQIWRPDYGQRNIREFSLSRLRGDMPRRVVYAGSFGTDTPTLTEEEIKTCREGYKNFEAISTRESCGLDILKKYEWQAKTESQNTLDPTLLLRKEHYSTLLPSQPSESEGRIFTYVLDASEGNNAVTAQISSMLNLEIMNFFDKGIDHSELPSIENWLAGIRDAEFVITDSFHGCVFSIIFNKPFAVTCNSARGNARFKSILSALNLQNRMTDGSAESLARLKEGIDWKEVNATKEILAQNSINFLESSLH